MRRLAVVAAAFATLVLPATAYGWTWPASGEVLEPFVFGGDPYAGGQHRGIDVAGEKRSSVLAPASGDVAFAGSVGANGKVVTIETDDGYSVTLVQLGSFSVRKGDAVREGSEVGTIGPSGTPEHEVPYVHLGIRVTSDPQGYVDPLTLLPPRTAPAPPPPPPSPAPPPAVELAPPPPVHTAPPPAPEPTPAPQAEPQPAEPPAEPLSDAPQAPVEPASALEPAAKAPTREAAVTMPVRAGVVRTVVPSSRGESRHVLPQARVSRRPRERGSAQRAPVGHPQAFEPSQLAGVSIARCASTPRPRHAWAPRHPATWSGGMSLSRCLQQRRRRAMSTNVRSGRSWWC